MLTDVYLSHEILPTKMPPAEIEDKYIKTYNLWKEVWSSTFLELKGEQKIYSDDFLRCDSVSVLFSAGQAIGMVGYMFVDLNLKSYLDHSYFKTYPTSALRLLKEQGHGNVLVISYLTVKEEWRKSQSGISISEILIGLATKKFLSLPTSAMISFTRNDRSVNHLVYRYGAVPLQADCIEHNVKVDIVAFYRDKIKASSVPGVAGYVDELWRKSGCLLELPPDINPPIFGVRNDQVA